MHRRVTSPRRRERPFSVRPPQHPLLRPLSSAPIGQCGNGGRGAGPRSRESGRAPRGAQGVKSFLWLCARHSGFAVCPAGDLAKGLEAAASGEAVSGGRRRASPRPPASSRSSTSTQASEEGPGAARETPASLSPETEKQKQPWSSAPDP